MPTSLVPHLSPEKLRQQATEFLAKYYSVGTIPVPIESIVEFQLRLDIVPVPGLCRGPRGINGYLSADRTTVYVDQGHLERVESRYLFTLAHEVGHLQLHSEFYRGFSDDKEWLAFRQHLVDHDLATAEYQADTFAGLILVPEQNLPREAVDCFQKLAADVHEQSAEFDLSSEPFWYYVADRLGRRFNVSSITARIRLQNDGFWGRVL